MQVAVKPSYVSVEDYLAGEPSSEVRHEYIGGLVHAMAGASEEHNILTGNLFAAIHAHLRGKTCRVYAMDLKVRLEVSGETIFYYPDVMVACDPRDTDRYSKRHPKVLIEVLSAATEPIDRREKLLSYRQIDSLDEYVLVAQDQMQVTLFSRHERWQPQILNQAGDELRLESIGFRLPLAAIYEGVKL